MLAGGMENKVSNFESFAEATAILKEKTGWSDGEINEFIRLSANKVAEEQENQREYEAELTPDQRRKDIDYYTASIAGTLKDGDKWQPRVHEYSHTNEETLKRANNCAQILIKIFNKLKEENPEAPHFNLYKTLEGRKAITQALYLAKPGQASAILNQIDRCLEKEGLEVARYFTYFFTQQIENADVEYRVWSKE